MLNLFLSNCNLFILTLCRLGVIVSPDHTQRHTHTHTQTQTYIIRSVESRQTCDWPLAETSDTHKTLTRDRQPSLLAGIKAAIISKREAADPRLSPRGHWYRHIKSPFGKNLSYLGAKYEVGVFKMFRNGRRTEESFLFLYTFMAVNL
jgi:hypothetical protein